MITDKEECSLRYKARELMLESLQEAVNNIETFKSTEPQKAFDVELKTDIDRIISIMTLLELEDIVAYYVRREK
ncbi:unnamed protein product [marine sediment metagenome]|uniref:Uncharacterized protein n=1 Tax=marine sediment metagenome TaxID=412755 RepID=X1R2P0_9ZZZZ